MTWAAVSVPLRPRSVRAVEELLQRGPAVPLDAAALDRELALVAGTELLLLFEGEDADRIAGSLTVARPAALEGGELERHVAGPPRLLSAPLAWLHSTSATIEDPGQPAGAGVSFGALPGPGNSDGGGDTP